MHEGLRMLPNNDIRNDRHSVRRVRAAQTGVRLPTDGKPARLGSDARRRIIP